MDIANRDDLGNLSLAVALTTVSGFVDAVGFLQLGHLFVSFMSGNTTELGIALSRRFRPEAETIASIISVFVCGVILGRIIEQTIVRWHRPVTLGLEAALLLCAVKAHITSVATLMMGSAMGMQNGIIHRAAGTKTSLTFVTGTLVGMSERLADWLIGRGVFRAALPQFFLWLGFVVGAAAGGAAFSIWGLGSLACPAAAATILALITARSAMRAMPTG